jgi:hypothetical protein
MRLRRQASKHALAGGEHTGDRSAGTGRLRSIRKAPGRTVILASRCCGARRAMESIDHLQLRPADRSKTGDGFAQLADAYAAVGNADARRAHAFRISGRGFRRAMVEFGSKRWRDNALA